MKGMFKKEIAQILAITLMVQSFSGLEPLQVTASEPYSEESVKMDEDFIEKITDDVDHEISYIEEAAGEEKITIPDAEINISGVEEEQEKSTEIEIDESDIEGEKTTEETGDAEESDVIVVGIEIEAEPTKKVYSSGEELDITGLLVNVIYSDNSKISIESSEYQVIGFDTSVIGEQIIQVQYKEYTESFSVEVWVAHGTCGTNLTWSLDDAGELKVSGTGSMTYWKYSDSAPWYSYRQEIKSVVLENGVTSVGQYAFYSCRSLTSIRLPESVTSLGKKAFSYCSGLINMKLPKNIRYIESDTFYECSSLACIDLPEGLTSIGSYAFYNCSSLTSIDLPEGITSLGDSVFSGCSNLTSVDLPEGITSLGNHAFSYCSGLTSIELPENVTSLGNYVFSNCSSLTSIELPENVTSLGNYVFSNCSSLTNIDLPEGITSLGSYAFSGCSFKSISISKVVENISSKVFYGCTLKNIRILDGVESLGDSAFSGCRSLTSIELPESLTSIGDSVFYNCSSLTSIDLPEGVTSLGNYAFYNCSNNAVSYSEMSVKEEINVRSANVTAKVPITEFPHGDHLYIRVKAYDKAGNQSNYAGQQYIIDTVAPAVFSVKAGFEDDCVKVTWTGEPSSDLIGYRIYRKTGVNGEYSLLAQKKATEGQNEYAYKDTGLASEKITYYYKIESVDSCGNTSFIETDAVNLTDRTIPTAVISCESTMEKGVEYIIDASDSKDNSMIIAYHFDFGDGVTSTDKKAVHKYTEIGEYTITLTVTDDEGNSSSITKTVKVKERELLGTAKIRVIDENGNAVANAPVYFDLGEETQIIKKTDSKGYVSFTADVGKHTIGCVIADNQWLPAKKEIVVTAGTETSIELTMRHYTMIEGSFESKRMTFEEIKAAGIDISKPENQYFIQLDVTLVYEAEKLADTSIKYNPITGEIIAPPIIVETPDGGKHHIIPGVIVPEDTENITKEISVAYLEVPVGISILKDFFNVNLHIINNASAEFSMKDNRVTLNLPDGLTLMETESTFSDVTVSIDEIKGQTTETISWLVRSDKTGEYYLSADYSGILSEFNQRVYTTFVSKEAINVYGMSDMKLTVEVADKLDQGKGYYNLALKNNGSESTYLPLLDVKGDLLKTELLNAAGENILKTQEDIPEVLKIGHTLRKYCVTDVEVEYDDLTYELKEYALSLKNTYGIDVEIITKPLSDFVESEKLPLSILKQPENQEVKIGEKAVFTVEAEGDEVIYQWQYSTSAGKYWTNSTMEGSSTNSITVDALKKRNGQQYRCIVSDNSGDSIISEAAILTVTEKEPELTIVKEPEDQNVIAGNIAVFAVEAAGSALSYQWQYSKNGIYWYDSSMEGFNTASMKVSATAKRDGQQYRCVVRDASGEIVYSRAAILNIVKDMPSIVILEQPKDQNAEAGNNVVFSISAEGTELSYQWQYSKTGTYWYNSSMEGFDTASMKVTVTQKRHNYQYRCIVTDKEGNSLTSDPAVLKVVDNVQELKITEQPKNQSAKVGDTVSFQVIAEGTGLSYQWQYSKDGKYWFDSGMEGSNTASLIVNATAKRDGQQYRCIVTDKAGKTITTDAASLSIIKK